MSNQDFIDGKRTELTCKLCNESIFSNGNLVSCVCEAISIMEDENGVHITGFERDKVSIKKINVAE
jgi:hypothetical protein